MRIAVISYWVCPLTRLGVSRSGGMSVYILNLANSLAASGQTLDIFTRSHKENDDKILQLNRNVRIIHLTCNHEKDPYAGIKCFSQKIIDFSNNNLLHYNLIHSHYYLSGLVGKILCNNFRIPHIITFHTLGKIKEKYAGTVDKKRYLAEKISAQKADKIIVSTLLEKNDLITEYNIPSAKISAVFPGVNHRIFKKKNRLFSRKKLNLPSKKKIILFVGRIDPVKGINLLVEAIGRLIKERNALRRQISLILIGGDIKDRHFWKEQEMTRLKDQIIQSNISCCVKFIGSKPYDMLPYYYSAADIVVLPSVYETFGLVILEAMACGGIILASKVGGIKSVIRDKYNGRLFENGNVGDLERKLTELLINSKQNKYLGKNAMVYSQYFSWDKQARQILTIYKHLNREN